jgi:hypothetical protein
VNEEGTLTHGARLRLHDVLPGPCLSWVKLPHGAKTASCPFLHGGLNRSTQHFILEGKDGVWDGSKVS